MMRTPPQRRHHCPICCRPYRETDMVECTNCKKWLHYECVNVTDEVAGDDTWTCPSCRTTDITDRRSSKARSVCSGSSRSSSLKIQELENIDQRMAILNEKERLLRERQEVLRSIEEEELSRQMDSLLISEPMTGDEVVNQYLNEMTPAVAVASDVNVVNSTPITSEIPASNPARTGAIPKRRVETACNPVTNPNTNFSESIIPDRNLSRTHEHSIFNVDRSIATSVTDIFAGPVMTASTWPFSQPQPERSVRPVPISNDLSFPPPTSEAATSYNRSTWPFSQPQPERSIRTIPMSNGLSFPPPTSEAATSYNRTTWPFVQQQPERSIRPIPMSTVSNSLPFPPSRSEVPVSYNRTTCFYSQPPLEPTVRPTPIAQPEPRRAEAEPDINLRQFMIRQSLSRDLPTFSGKPEEWPTFISIFQYTTNECRYNETENMIRLGKCLTGKAREVVAPMLTMPHCVPQVIETLELYFGRPETLIEHYIERVRKLPAPRADKLETVFEFAIAVKNLCVTMQQANQTSHLNNPSLMKELVEKLPPMIKMNWALHKRTVANGDNLSTLSEYLRTLSADLCSVGITLNSSRNSCDEKDNRASQMNQRTKRQNKYNRESTNVHQYLEKTGCAACNGDCIELTKCESFIKLSLKEKWNLVKKMRLCNRCLQIHKIKCEKSIPCKVKNCDKKYHPILHRHEVIPHENCANVNQQPHETKAIFRIIPVVLYNADISVKTYAFLDEGSSKSMMSADLCKQLRLKGQKQPFCMRWTQNIRTWEKDSQMVDLEIAGTYVGAKKMKMNQVRTVKSLDLPKQSLNYDEMCSKYNYLRNLPIDSYTNANPQILIGQKNWKLAVPNKSKYDNSDGPIAIKCSLGWTICSEDSEHAKEYSLHICECMGNDQESMDQLMKEHFSVDSLGIDNPKRTVQLLEAERAKMLMSKLTTDEGDHFRTGLLWRYDDVRLPDSSNMAMQRLRCFERKLRNDPELLRVVREQMNDYLSKGYVRKLSDSELKRRYERVWYLPMFTVRNPNKPEKVRLVWDAKATVNGISLNTVLLKGTDINATLLGVLFRSRERKICINADIREMFHQVRVNDEDQQVLRFYWRDCDDSKAPDTYVMQVLTFGATCSPYCAQYIKNKNAMKYCDQYPRAVASILKNHYVDDLLDSVDTPDEAIQLAKEVKLIHSAAGFEICKWKSNSPQVMKAMDPESVVEALDMNPDTATEKILGMWWRLDTDEYTYSLKYNKGSREALEGKKIPTKRELVRILMSIYDPMGLISHFLVYLKMIIQEVWKSKIDWDTEISREQAEKWSLWLQRLADVEHIRIPRCYLSKFNDWSGVEVQLHVFTDAGEGSCACVAYLRMKKFEVVDCVLVGSKTKATPLKMRSIPRLELDAAVMGSRFAKTIHEELSIQIHSVRFWCDSTVVLSWLYNADKRYSKFVAFRTAEVMENSQVSEWSHIPTKYNIADICTKWTTPPKLSAQDEWFKGPRFLYLAEENWPKGKTKMKETEEELCFMVEEVEPVIDVKRSSSWTKLLNVTAYVYRFAKNITAKVKKEKLLSGILNSEELKAAQTFLLKLAQQQCFSQEMALIKKGKPVARSSALYMLSPYLDDEGLLRIKGRLDAAVGLSIETKRPVIMPREHYVTFLIVDDMHRKLLHQNHETTVAMIRQKYYIPKLRVLTKKVRNQCIICRIKHAKPQVPEMAPLPLARLSTATAPFTYVGIDCFGPLYVSVKRSTAKRYGVIFTCLTIRAVHVEMVYSMEADSFIVCLRNFMSRRGQPRVIYSDNGTNFIKAERLLKEELEAVDFSKVAREFVSPELEWRFNPPSCAHMGGAWERLIKSIKNAVYASLPTFKNPTDELLNGCLIAAEAMVNQRPLAYIPIDDPDQDVLTPNHFLSLSSGGSKPLGEVNIDEKALRSRYKYVEQFAEKCWRRFVMEYLPNLLCRNKWHEITPGIQVNDIVVVIDEKLPRNNYPKGRVIEVFPGADGQIRSVKIQTSAGIMRRPVAKLAVLKVTQRDDGNTDTNGEEEH